MKQGQIFDIEIDGVLKSAELLDIVDYKEERYAVYFTENDETTSNIYISKIVKDSNGNDELVDFDDEEVKNYILKIIHDTINR